MAVLRLSRGHLPVTVCICQLISQLAALREQPWVGQLPFSLKAKNPS